MCVCVYECACLYRSHSRQYINLSTLIHVANSVHIFVSVYDLSCHSCSVLVKPVSCVLSI